MSAVVLGINPNRYYLFLEFLGFHLFLGLFGLGFFVILGRIPHSATPRPKLNNVACAIIRLIVQPPRGMTTKFGFGRLAVRSAPAF